MTHDLDFKYVVLIW